MMRLAILMMTVLALALVVCSTMTGAHPLIIWNATASAPLGFYGIEPGLPLRLGDLVLLNPDPVSAMLYDRRGYLPRGVPLLKPIAAMPGMRICEQDRRLSIDGQFAAMALQTDGLNRPMAAWSGCRVLERGELFVLNPAVRTSLDGRYFGPSPMAAVLGRAVPIWTWSGH